MDYLTYEHFDVDEAVKAQEDYCEAHEMPCFMPDGGLCPRCGRNIFDPRTYHGREGKTFGISVEDAGKRLMPSCPTACRNSFHKHTEGA